ncbi:hypothetical protein GH714_006513 [Hevea brasiliensis]|uniref:Filament-like plant protein n=1 Tax=Hevea brasiliensis TaxID=3981 RepID=A0A6A6MC76_HEVBR|nr:hypothetical protein GH714_006513 [Hevea brasiliensis]
MDRRSWPWKKKSSDKADKNAAATDFGGGNVASSGSRADKDNYKKPNYVQISVESYTHLTGLEDQVKTYEQQVQTLEDEIKELNEKLSGANSEMTTKENLVKQHAKVAEEAVSGWEKAEAEALALKNHLESVTLSKLAAEDRASHLDGALKECMRQIQKSQAEAEIELLKSNIESCEREINSLKYELHVVSKELEIRNEEKNMSMRSAEAANKQHMEGVKKIAKLEAECQRLRGLVRKKLPGPAALAQMKLEVENLGRDYGDSRLRQSPVKPPSPHLSAMPEFSHDNAQKFHKENEFLTERLFSMEEETKMLKEALAKRNSELQASRNLCAKTASRLQILEAQLQVNNQQKSSPKSMVQAPTEGYSCQNMSNPPSLTSMSEDGHNDDQSCADSWATSLISELSQLKKDKSSEKPNKTKNAKHLELMDDFLEMEKLACLNADGAITISDSPNNKTSEIVSGHPSVEISSGKDTLSEEKSILDPLMNHLSSNMDLSAVDSGSDADQPPLMKLRSRISILLETASKGADAGKILEDVKRVVQDAHDALHRQSVALPENKVLQRESSGESYQNGCPHVSSPTSNPEVPDDGNLVSGYGSNTRLCKVSLEEFQELKSEKDNISVDLARCTENLEMTKSQLHETEQLLAEAKSQLASAQKSNSLAETQLKCMAESYRSLEARAEELETEVNLLRAKAETLENELQDEKQCHWDALTKCKELEEQLQMKESCSVCSSSADADLKTKQERELASAAEKLAECQETIFLLGKQLKALHPQAELMGSPYSERSQRGEGFPEDEPTTSGMNLQDFDQAEIDGTVSTNLHRSGAESPMDLYNQPCSPSNTEASLPRSPINSKHPKHRSTKSTSSSSSLLQTPEKHPREDDTVDEDNVMNENSMNVGIEKVNSMEYGIHIFDQGDNENVEGVSMSETAMNEGVDNMFKFY